jgi:hypothetical protein
MVGKKLLGGLLMLAAGWSFPAFGATITNDVISGSYDYPCYICTDTGSFWYSVNPFVVSGATPQTTLFTGTNQIYYAAWSVLFSGNSLMLTMIPAPFASVFYSADPFNGPVFTVVSGNTFGSVTGIDASLHCVPCNPITASVSGDSLFVNWEGAGGDVGDTITLTFTVAGHVGATPIPATLPLFATGLSGLGLLGWRRKRKNAAAIAA